MVNVAPSTVATVAFALSPGSLLFPFSGSGFASSSSRPFALPPPPPPPPLPSSVALSSSSISSLASSSFSLSLPFSPSPLPPTPAFPSPLAPPASSFPSSSSLSASAAVRPPPGFAPLPHPPPGLAPLTPSLSPPLSSSSAVPSFSSSLPPGCVSFSAGLAPPVLSSSSSSFPPLDFASYQASMLGLSQDYQSLARWYFLSGGSDFLAYLSAFYPHLSSDASRDFSSGSSVFFSALRAVTSSVPLPTVSSAAPPLPSVASVSSTRTPAPLPLPAPVSAPSEINVHLVSQLGGGLYALVSAQVLPQAPPGVPSLSTASTLLSVPPPAVPSSSLPTSRPPGVSVFYPPASSLLPSASLAWPVSSAPGLGSPPLVSVAPSLPAVTLPGVSVFSAASALPPFCSAPLGSAAGLSGFASASAGSTFGFAGSAPQPGPAPAYPPLSGPSAPPSAPPLSDFDYGNDDAFAPGFGDPDSSGAAAPDPEAPVPPPLSDSARAEVRHMYQYLVDLFPQSAGSSPAPLPPRALFEEFFAAPSPHQPVFLSWFERVRSTLSGADARILSLLASGRPESSLLPPRQSQYSVGSSSSLGSAAPVNPSLLAMFERPLRPSLHLGLTLREASLLESSSRALSETQSHVMWLLSGLLGFVRLQGFSPSDSPLFNTLVSSLSKCLAHQASVSASLTAFMGTKRRQF